MYRELGQPSVVEAWLPGNLGQNRRLERIAELVDWSRLGALVAGSDAAPGGPWYNLSDPQMEEALGDRRSCRRFVGRGLQDDTPNHSTIN